MALKLVMQSADARGVSTAYIGWVPNSRVSVTWGAWCYDDTGIEVPVTWTVTPNGTMAIRGANGEDPSITPLASIVCEPVQWGDCYLTATSNTESVTARVRILGALSVEWDSNGTCYCAISRQEASQVYDPAQADFKILAGDSWDNKIDIEFLNSNLGYEPSGAIALNWMYDFTPDLSLFVQQNLSSVEGFVFKNRLLETVLVALMEGPTGALLVYFII